MTRSQKEVARQKSRHAQGLCNLCDEPLVTKWHCAKHAEAVRNRARIYSRMKNGIALTNPLGQTSKYKDKP